MLLAQALRCNGPVSLALVGAGGKTMAMFQLARELSRPAEKGATNNLVFVSTTTHLSEEQYRLADFHFPVESQRDIRQAVSDLAGGVALFTGSHREGGRIAGLSMSFLDKLYETSKLRKCSLLIEADGSRMLPVKAPAEHEPAIPTWVEMVVVCAGLSAMGKPLDSHWVHRPELFSRLCGLSLGQTIQPAALSAVLLNPQGGLKNIPASARRSVLLNQADTPELQSMARTMADALLSEYHSVIIAALKAGLPKGNLQQLDEVFAVYERVAGIILAAGGSERMGQPKQVLPWKGKPIIRHLAQTAIDAGLQPVIVVSGAASAEVERALLDLPVLLAFNPQWSTGQSTSVKTGLQQVPPETGAAIFMLADQPYTSRELIKGLVELHAATLSPLVAPEVQGQRANPVLFDRRTFEDLLTLEGDVGGRPLFSRYRATWLPWVDASILLDIDTPQDYRRLLEE